MIRLRGGARRCGPCRAECPDAGRLRGGLDLGVKHAVDGGDLAVNPLFKQTEVLRHNVRRELDELIYSGVFARPCCH